MTAGWVKFLNRPNPTQKTFPKLPLGRAKRKHAQRYHAMESRWAIPKLTQPFLFRPPPGFDIHPGVGTTDACTNGNDQNVQQPVLGRIARCVGLSGMQNAW